MRSIDVFERRTNIAESRHFSSIVTEIAKFPRQSVLFCNVHMLMLSQEDQALADAMDSADWVFADGVPVSWLQSKTSGKKAKVIRGYEIMLAVCERAARTGERIGLFGSTDGVIEALVQNLRKRCEGLNIVFEYCPPFMKDMLVSTPEDLQRINDSQVDWLFIGLGCPKQEKWIANYKDELNCNILGVGAAFDWISEKVNMPPKWMESSGLGWLYRLLKNPRKLWGRYLVYNSKFMIRYITLSLNKE